MLIAANQLNIEKYGRWKTKIKTDGDRPGTRAEALSGRKPKLGISGKVGAARWVECRGCGGGRAYGVEMEGFKAVKPQ